MQASIGLSKTPRGVSKTPSLAAAAMTPMTGGGSRRPSEASKTPKAPKTPKADTSRPALFDLNEARIQRKKEKNGAENGGKNEPAGISRRQKITLMKESY